MPPTSTIRKLIGGILARYQEQYGILIYTYCILGNHYHLLIRAPKGNTDEFLENVNREISRRVNWMFGRGGHLWSRRYDDQEVLPNEADLIDAFLYVTTNPCRHGLVRYLDDYNGLNALSQLLNENDRIFSFKRRTTDEVTTHRLKLSILPPFEKMSKNVRRRTILKLVRERIKAIEEQRATEGKGFLGICGLRKLGIGSKPQEISRKNRPPCFTSSFELKREYRERLKERRTWYLEASRWYRLKNFLAEFPPFSFKPPTHRVPNRVIKAKFIPLSELGWDQRPKSIF